MSHACVLLSSITSSSEVKPGQSQETIARIHLAIQLAESHHHDLLFRVRHRGIILYVGFLSSKFEIGVFGMKWSWESVVKILQLHIEDELAEPVN